MATWADRDLPSLQIAFPGALECARPAWGPQAASSYLGAAGSAPHSIPPLALLPPTPLLHPPQYIYEKGKEIEFSI